MYKHIFSFLTLIAFLQLTAVIPTGESVSSLINQQRKPTEALQKIISLTGIPNQPDLDLQKLIAITQKEDAQWLRPRVAPAPQAASTPAAAQPVFAERNAIKPVFPDKKEELMAVFKQLGWCDPIKPKAKSFKYGLLLGSVASNMRRRMAFLEQLCKTGEVKVEKLVLLTGKRAVTVADPGEVDFLKTIWKDDAFVETLKTEADIAKALLLHTDFFPTLKTLPLTAIGAEAEKGQPRATTAQPVAEWLSCLKEEELSGACLAVSSNPFVAYQDIVMRTALPQTMTLETCGDVDARLHSETGLGNCLDSLARVLFQYDKWLAEVAKLPAAVKTPVLA